MRWLSGSELETAKCFMEEAGSMAATATCQRDKCGAIVVSCADAAGLHPVIGSGANGPPNNDESQRMCAEATRPSAKPKSDRTCCVHAEWRALLDACMHHPHSVRGASLYFTRVARASLVLPELQLLTLGTICLVPSGKPYCTVCSRLALEIGLAEVVLWHKEGIAAYPTPEYNRRSYDYQP